MILLAYNSSIKSYKYISKKISEFAEKILTKSADNTVSMSTLFEKIGGYDALKKVHKIFYDKIYEHDWIGLFFKEISQTVIEDQQTDFMAQAMGGPEKYRGAFPVPAHQHIFITEELFELRHNLLKDSLKEAGLAEENIQSWLKIDYAFKKALVKNGLSNCTPRFKTDDILAFPNPKNKKAA